MKHGACVQIHCHVYIFKILQALCCYGYWLWCKKSLRVRACMHTCAHVCVDLQWILAHFASYITWAGLKKLINLICPSSRVSLLPNPGTFHLSCPIEQHKSHCSYLPIVLSVVINKTMCILTVELLAAWHCCPSQSRRCQCLDCIEPCHNSATIHTEWNTLCWTYLISGGWELFPWWVAIPNGNVLWWHLGHNIDQNTAAAEHLKQNTELWYHMLW